MRILRLANVVVSSTRLPGKEVLPMPLASRLLPLLLLCALGCADVSPSGDGGVLPDGGPSCTPTTCQALEKNCGAVPDGCGGTVSCGECGDAQSCGGGGVANVCGRGVCTPKSCAELGFTCGMASDGCSDSSAACVSWRRGAGRAPMPTRNGTRK